VITETSTTSNEVGQRQQPRMTFQRRAHLLIDGLPAPVPARINNLSATGTYLRAERLPSIGSTCLCRFVIGGDEVVLRCRVKWIDYQWTPGRDLGPGAGMAFIGVGARERGLLEMALGIAPTPVVNASQH